MKPGRRLYVVLFAFTLSSAAVLAGCAGGASAPSAVPAGPATAPSAPAVPGAPAAAAIAPPAGTDVLSATAGKGVAIAPPPLLRTETPRMADAFVDSVGFNVHLSYYGTLYADRFPAVAALLAQSGVRHLRDAVTVDQAPICRNWQQLAAAGIHVQTETWPNLLQPELSAWFACAGPAIEAAEGPNEYDIGHPPEDSAWAATLTNYQTLLYNGVKALTSLVPVVAPALTNDSAYSAVNVPADFANMHDYFAGRNPGTGGWGATNAFGTYGALSWNMAIARQSAPGKPVYATESGYGDLGDQYGVPASVKADYTVRMLLEHWNAGVARTFVYELVDEGPAPFAHYGLVDGNGNQKPAFVAVKNLVHHFTDAGSPFSPAPLAYGIGASAAIHHALLQRRNGTYSIVFWKETAEWDVDAHAPVASVPERVALTFGHVPRSLSVTNFNASGSAIATPFASAASTAISVGPSISIVDVMF